MDGHNDDVSLIFAVVFYRGRMLIKYRLVSTMEVDTVSTNLLPWPLDIFLSIPAVYLSKIYLQTMFV